MTQRTNPAFLTMINTALSAATLLYVVNTEHRITALETRVQIAVQLQQQARDARENREQTPR